MRIPAVFLCIILLACDVNAMVSADEPRDQLSDAAAVQLSLDGIGDPAFDLALFSDLPTPAQDAASQENAEDAEGEGGAEGSDPLASISQQELLWTKSGVEGSNPLASVSKLDLLWTLTGAGDTETHDVSAEGSFMLNTNLRFDYEVHYFFTDITGSSENNWKSIHLKPIFFLLDKNLNDDWAMRIAVGGEYIHSFDNVDQGIGADSDIIAPLFGLGFAKPAQGLALILLVQHFLSVGGTSANLTAFGLIGLQPLPDACWLKLEAKVIADWHHDTTPIIGELEFGKMLNPNMGLFGNALFGVGGDRPFDWGVAAGVRFNF